MTNTTNPFTALRGGEIMGRFPAFFQEALLPSDQTPMGFGLSCGEGWWNIIEAMCEKLQAAQADVQFTQVKNKLGSLCIYYRSTTPDLTVPLVQYATKKAAATCEHCGAPGSKTASGGWWSVLCPWHEVQVLRCEVQRLLEQLDALSEEDE